MFTTHTEWGEMWFECLVGATWTGLRTLETDDLLGFLRIKENGVKKKKERYPESSSSVGRNASLMGEEC